MKQRADESPVVIQSFCTSPMYNNETYVAFEVLASEKKRNVENVKSFSSDKRPLLAESCPIRNSLSISVTARSTDPIRDVIRRLFRIPC